MKLNQIFQHVKMRESKFKTSILNKPNEFYIIIEGTINVN